jgi:hypothetical protein
MLGRRIFSVFVNDANGSVRFTWIHDVCVALIVNNMQRLNIDLGNDEEVSNLMGALPTTEKLGGDFKFIVELVSFLESWKDCDRCFFQEFHNIEEVGWFQLQEDPTV